MDLVCIFNEIKSVVFTSLNFERAGIVLKKLYKDFETGTEALALTPDIVAKKVFSSMFVSEKLKCC